MSSLSLSRFCGLTAHILVLAFVCLVVFGGTAVVIAFFLSWIQGSSFGSGANWYAGMICGLVAWLFVAVFHFRKETIQLPIQEREAFAEQVKDILDDLGYETGDESANHWLFRPGFQSYLLGGSVQVKVDGQQASISGPKVSVEALRRRLRVQNHLKKASPEERKPQGERILKRVQLTFRVPRDHWQAVFENVVTPLASEGEVACQVSVSVQNEKGIGDTTVDGPVRKWLEQHGMTADIHKSHAQA